MSQPDLSRSDRVPWWKNPRGEWYVIAQTFLFALIALGPGWIDVRPGLPSGIRAAVLLLGGALGGVGLVFALGGLLALGDNLSPLPHPKEGATLVQGGMYGVVRHPIYSGLVLGAFGWALINASLLTLVYAIVLFVFFDIKSRREERWLARKFPAYDGYRRRVRKLIPFVY
jgi:protein-S-isoprenylcysteine O-methyltransferase Ste14